MLYPQNGDRIVAINDVTALHPIYSDEQFLLQTEVLSIQMQYKAWRTSIYPDIDTYSKFSPTAENF